MVPLRRLQRLSQEREISQSLKSRKIQEMEQLPYLSGFFLAIENDPRISITHIGIYAALLQYWSQNQYANPLQAFSYEIMKIAKISAKRTYHKTIRELSEYGYLKYQPSFKRNQGSRVFLLSEDETDNSMTQRLIQ